MENCTFCKIYNNQKGIIHESEYFFAQFDAYPVSPGHAEIIPKRHVVSLFELCPWERADLQQTLEDVKNVIENTCLYRVYQGFITNALNETSAQFCEKAQQHESISNKPDGYNIGVNEGTAAWRTIDHLHFHIIPRYVDDVEDCIGWIRHIIPGMGNYKK